MKKGGVSVTGLEQIRNNLQKLKRTHAQNVVSALRDIGNIAVAESVKRAPIDAGTLVHDIEKSIQQERNETAVVIRVPLNAPSSQYAMPMHENDYNLGVKSQKKEGRVGVNVGKGYIRRGVEAGIPSYDLIINDKLKVKS